MYFDVPKPRCTFFFFSCLLDLQWEQPGCFNCHFLCSGHHTAHRVAVRPHWQVCPPLRILDFKLWSPSITSICLLFFWWNCLLIELVSRNWPLYLLHLLSCISVKAFLVWALHIIWMCVVFTSRCVLQVGRQELSDRPHCKSMAHYKTYLSSLSLKELISHTHKALTSL